MKQRFFYFNIEVGTSQFICIYDESDEIKNFLTFCSAKLIITNVYRALAYKAHFIFTQV